jgi:hypothetical protein
MVGLFGQVWVLCGIAFLAGSAVTWLVFVRQPRLPLLPPPPPPTEMARWAPEPAQERVARHQRPPDRPLPVEPALANLDTHRRDVPPRHAGSVAAGALDRLGVTGPIHVGDSGPGAAAEPATGRIPAQGRVTGAGPDIPAQAGPVDGPAPHDDDAR